MISWARSEEALALEHDKLEKRAITDGLELMRLLAEAHLGLRALLEQRRDDVRDADGGLRHTAEDGQEHTRVMIFGPVRTSRMAYRKRGKQNLYPQDTELNWAAGHSYSAGVEKRAAKASAIALKKSPWSLSWYRRVHQLVAHADLDALDAALTPLAVRLLLKPHTRGVWVAVAGTCGAAVAAYVWSRAVGLPQIADDVGHWTEPLGVVSIAAEAVAVACAAVTLAGRRNLKSLRPAVRWSLTWQWKSQMPGLSGTMSATTMLAGSRLTTSIRIPLTVTSLPCQWGVCRSTSVPMLITYQRTRSPFRTVIIGMLPYTYPLIECFRFDSVKSSLPGSG